MTRNPNADVRRGARIERAAWMDQINGGLYNVVKRIAEGERCEFSDGRKDPDSIAELVCRYLRTFGELRAERTADSIGGVGRK